jgi:hypothetical protein
MSAQVDDRLFARVRAHAFRTLSFAQQDTTNLYLDERIYEAGETIGPHFQRIVAQRPSILVFADDDPRANFGHACRYLLYDAETGEFQHESPARLPPYVATKPATLRPFHAPVRFVETPNLFHVRPDFRCPILVSSNNRYAIMFSGWSGKAPLNDMEFLYRTLIDIYSFDPNNICALHFDGSFASVGGPATTWPGDGTPYRIRLTGPGTRAAFDSAVDELKAKLRRDDLLLIHTNQCGDWDGKSGTTCLYTYPNADPYDANALATKLGELPRFGQLCVMMGQCSSGGFTAPIIAHSAADATSVACAAAEQKSAFPSLDGNWGKFARDWIAAQAGHTPFGTALAFSADSDGDGKIEAEEAFGYANALRDPGDSPNFSESSEIGGDIALGQEYVVWWWWCSILKEALEQYRVKLPPHEYYARLHRIQPALAELTGGLDKRSDELRREMTAKVGELVASGFKS